MSQSVCMSLDRAGVTVLVTGSGEFVVAYLATTALLPSCELVINTFSLHQMNWRGLGKTMVSNLLDLI